MSKKKGGHGGGGGHGGAWVITFADLMALLMAFFVMLLASANQDKQKLADAAGSLKDAFGVVQKLQAVLGQRYQAGRF